jgi:hypothetical protein
VVFSRAFHHATKDVLQNSVVICRFGGWSATDEGVVSGQSSSFFQRIPGTCVFRSLRIARPSDVFDIGSACIDLPDVNKTERLRAVE